MANLDLSNSQLSENNERVLREYWDILLEEGYLDKGNNELTKYANGVQNHVAVTNYGRMVMSNYKIIVDGHYPSYCSFLTYHFSDIDSGIKFKSYAENMLLQSEMLTFKSIAFKQASNSIVLIILNNGFNYKEIDDRGTVKYTKVGKDDFKYEFAINHTDQKIFNKRIGMESVQENTCDFDDINELTPEQIFTKLSVFPLRS
ncbi:hypothetical protein [Chryseobacterium sp.]|uniref:hypothetical protein n=1 Tax=Chryseobacterium sp. TaxID=1871047 RepID=UPI0026371B44|nr:hypothetical protein [Chryseobacterium sp.]